MKTITFFVNQSLESPSGVGRYFPIAKNLVKLGCIVNIIALHHNFSSLKEKFFLIDGVNIYYVGQMHVLKINDKKVYFNKLRLIQIVLSSTLKMFWKGLQLKSDIYYIFKPQPINGGAALMTALIKRKKLFVDCDDYEAESNNTSSYIEKKVFAFFEDHIPKFAQLITFHNSFLKTRYQKLGVKEEKFLYLPNGVEFERFDNLKGSKIEALIEQLHLKSKRVILYFGSLSIGSGHSIDLLIDAFELVNQKIKNSVLLLVGSGEDYDFIKEYIKEKNIQEFVIFTGRVDKNEIPYYLKISDVSIDPVRDTPSNRARFPLKIVESMALGIPIITGDVGDRKIIIKNKETGILVSPGNKEDLANGIIEIISNKKLSKKISIESLKAVKNYEWKKIVNNLQKPIFS